MKLVTYAVLVERDTDHWSEVARFRTAKDLEHATNRAILTLRKLRPMTVHGTAGWWRLIIVPYGPYGDPSMWA